MSQKEPIKVLYIHGIDGFPQGIKSIWLEQAGFQVETPDMSKVIQHARGWSNTDTWTVIAVVCTIFGADFVLLNYAWKNSTLFPIILVGVLSFIGGTFGVRTYRNIVTKLHKTCLDIQKALLNKWKPDVVIGSSWGGSVTLELMKQGVWKGPTILLGPAQDTVAGKMGLECPNLPKVAAPCHIYHGTADKTIPYQHSTRLVDAYTKAYTASDVKLIECPGDDHQLTLTMKGPADMKKVVLDVLKDTL